ncbi:HupE/UreJ family protein, partial [Ralstonia pseudosolanacearum]
QAMFPSFVAGFAAATALLHAAGIGAGLALKPRLAWLARLSGVGVALYGAGLLAAAV